MVKYETVVNKVGEMVGEGMEENLIILFNDNAPEMYHEYCLLHTITELKEGIEAGDIFCIDTEEYKITAVGSGANKTIEELGHATIKFDGSPEAENPDRCWCPETFWAAAVWRRQKGISPSSARK